jgi:DNA-binding transcriptional ArsR family regulator
MSAADPVGPVFAALADPTRRHVLQTALREGSVTVPQLTAELPMSRQAVAKHVDALRDAGLLAREGEGRRLAYRPEPEALRAATAWLQRTEREWDTRLGRLKTSVES